MAESLNADYKKDIFDRVWSVEKRDSQGRYESLRSVEKEEKKTSTNSFYSMLFCVVQIYSIF